jgi:para-nitrobenzyl esterase
MSNNATESKVITINKLVLFLAIVILPLSANDQKKDSAQASLVAGSDIAIVQTEYGKVRGFIHDGTFIYKGIPYAKAERFIPPARPDTWDGIRNSMAWGPVCPLMNQATLGPDLNAFMFPRDLGISSEDCLRLNIWTPGINDGKKRPVMFYIHGGGYTSGSSQEYPPYDGENLSKTGNVVYVSMNHRLNVLGFLDLSGFGEKYKLSGNVGIIDLVAALEWVSSNIANFGGDPDNITIYGHSGGGGKVSTLMNAPSAKGLFHKAVAQSGTNIKFQKQQVTQRLGKTVVEELKLEPSQIDAIQKVPYAELAAATQRAMRKVMEQLVAENDPDIGSRVGLSPTLDGNFLPYEATDPRALAISKDVPFMIGTAKNEFRLWGNLHMKNASLDTIKNFIKKTYGDKADAYIAAVKQAYPEYTKPTDLIDLDIRFRRNAVRHANLKSSHSDAPVFMYIFTWQSPVFDGHYKAIHCMELPFVANNIALWEELTGGGKEAYVLADKMSKAWVHFARYGDPNHKGLPKWQPYTEENGATMFFDNECIVRHHHDREFLKITAEETNIL